MNKPITTLLEADKRHWNQREFFELTVKFLTEEILSTMQRPPTFLETKHTNRLIDRIATQLYQTSLKNKKLAEKVKIILIFINTDQYLLAEEYIQALYTANQLKNPELLGLMSVLLAEVHIEKMEYRKANEYFLLGLERLNSKLDALDLMEYYLKWTALFIESGDIDFAERLLNTISSKLTPQHTYLYTNMLYLHFVLRKKSHRPEATITYANLLNSCEVSHLQNDEWYNLHLFCGDYYSNVEQNFEMTIYHYKHANSFLTNKWKDYARHISELKLILKPAEYMEVSSKYNEKLLIIVLENSLHNNHFITSLKTAYDELQEAHKKMKEFSYIDNLTGLYNRRYLWERSTEFLQRAKNRHVAISCFMIDLDNFKKLNDTFGHLESDKVLKKVSQIIQTFFRKTDIVIRFGGDEVLALLYNINSENARVKAERLCREIEDMVVIGEGNVAMRTTVSIGISSVERVVVEDKGEVRLLNAMIEEADRYLYQAKEEGRNRYAGQIGQFPSH